MRFYAGAGFSLCFFMAAASVAVASGTDTGAITSRYTPLTDCSDFDSGDLDQGEDWVLNRCLGVDGIPVWLLFTDSARAHVGFGRVANFTGTFDIDRDDAWLIEWRGHLQGDRFEPFAAIIRMPLLESEDSELVVFRLRSDGTSCVIGSTSASNEKARRTADGALNSFECAREPQLL